MKHRDTDTVLATEELAEIDRGGGTLWVYRVRAVKVARKVRSFQRCFSDGTEERI